MASRSFFSFRLVLQVYEEFIAQGRAALAAPAAGERAPPAGPAAGPCQWGRIAGPSPVWVPLSASSHTHGSCAGGEAAIGSNSEGGGGAAAGAADAQTGTGGCGE